MIIFFMLFPKQFNIFAFMLTKYVSVPKNLRLCSPAGRFELCVERFKIISHLCYLIFVLRFSKSI